MSEAAADLRTETWTVSTASEHALWETWSRAVLAARHPSLARVEGVARNDGTGTLTLLDPDSESVTAWAERTDASVPERLAVLRAAAAALDALYAGTAVAEGIPHGALSTASLRIDVDGATRLVGFAPWTSAEPADTRFHAPELRAASPATRSGDVYAFARVVAELLGGATVAAAEDVPGVVRALRTAPETRRRARLVKAIETTLAAPAEARAQPLTAWLAAAVEGTVATEVKGIAPELVPASAQPAPRPRIARLAVGLAVATAIGIGAWAIGSHDRNPRQAGTAPTKPAAFRAHATWAPLCGPASGLAGAAVPDQLSRATTPDELNRSASEIKVGRWHQGRLLITLVGANDEQPLVINKIDAERVSNIDPATWIARPPIHCTPGPAPDQLLEANLDDRSTKVAVAGRASKFNQLGGLTLDTSTTVIAIDVTACQGNYLWRPIVHYALGSTSGVLPLATFRTYGAASAAPEYQLEGGRATPAELLTNPVSGGDPAC